MDANYTRRLLNLAIMPEFVEELREELCQVLAENNGEFTSNTLQSLEKMDSLLKESLRTHPSTIGMLCEPQKPPPLRAG